MRATTRYAFRGMRFDWATTSTITLHGRATNDPDLKRMFPMKGAGKTGVFIALLAFTEAVAAPGYAQDAEHGRAIFKACAACHATDQANRVGPGLEGIIGRKAGMAPGFRYSDAMKQSGIVWDAKTLDAYLESPQKVVPGNRMTYGGLKNPTDRMDLATYLATLK